MKRIIFVILTLLSSAFGALEQESSSNQDVSRLTAAPAQIVTEPDKTALKETLVKHLSTQQWNSNVGHFSGTAMSMDSFHELSSWRFHVVT